MGPDSREYKTVVVIVPAAGRGERFSPDANKPFAELLGKPLLCWALEALEASGMVAEIIPVLKEEDMEKGTRMVEEFSISRVNRIARGGKKRQDSVLNALRLVEDSSQVVLVHDGARPMLDAMLIKRTLDGLSGYDGAVAAVLPKDTIKEANEDGVVANTPRRHLLRAVQTPQAFPFDTIMDAYLRADKDGFIGTDDSALVERQGGRINLVEGSYENIKITTPEDLEIAELLLRKRLK
jgi:2-C-methyl-D-erythritol 4-phosphate cytidylyltransferase